MSFDRKIFGKARREFLSCLRYAKGHRSTTCYAYNSATSTSGEASKDWQRTRTSDVQQFVPSSCFLVSSGFNPCCSGLLCT
jgi:hypothetical protein